MSCGGSWPESSTPSSDSRLKADDHTQQERLKGGWDHRARGRCGLSNIVEWLTTAPSSFLIILTLNGFTSIITASGLAWSASAKCSLSYQSTTTGPNIHSANYNSFTVSTSSSVGFPIRWSGSPAVCLPRYFPHVSSRGASSDHQPAWSPPSEPIPCAIHPRVTAVLSLHTYQLIHLLELQSHSSTF